MKLIYAIVRTEDGNGVMEELNKKGFSVTKLASTGGFLHSGNTTLIIGTDEDKVSEVMEIVKIQCGPRQKITASAVSMGGMSGYAAMPITVDVGGATIFVLNVERFERL